MEDNTYNGWTNYETWNWKLWIDNDPGSYEYYAELASAALNDADSVDDAVSALADTLAFEADDAAEALFGEQSITGPFADILNAGMGRINWHEIAHSLISNAEEF